MFHTLSQSLRDALEKLNFLEQSFSLFLFCLCLKYFKQTDTWSLQ